MSGRVPEFDAGFLAQVARVTEGMRLLREQYGDFMASDLPDLHATLTALETSLSSLRSARGGSSVHRDGAD